MIRDHGGGDSYLADPQPSRRLTPAQLAAITESADIMGGFAVPERSVQTHVVADWFLNAIKAQPEITTHFSCRVTGLTQRDDGWRINATPALDGPFDIVINALWEGRAAIDRHGGHRGRRDLVVSLSPASVRQNRPSVRSAERHDRDRTIRRHQELQRA